VTGASSESDEDADKGKNSRRAGGAGEQRRPIDIAHYFTEDFRLDDAGSGVVRTGHAGAQAMFDDIFSLAEDIRYEILDTVEAADRVAVRWCVTGTRTTGSFDVAMIGFYRFVDGRIAEDWAFGVASPGRRPERSWGA
jgi:predicted SnoaL-like aldol condensation-catalyzing enzyme